MLSINVRGKQETGRRRLWEDFVVSPDESKTFCSYLLGLLANGCRLQQFVSIAVLVSALSTTCGSHQHQHDSVAQSTDDLKNYPSMSISQYLSVGILWKFKLQILVAWIQIAPECGWFRQISFSLSISEGGVKCHNCNPTIPLSITWKLPNNFQTMCVTVKCNERKYLFNCRTTRLTRYRSKWWKDNWNKATTKEFREEHLNIKC